jgi:hypothetical protein
MNCITAGKQPERGWNASEQAALLALLRQRQHVGSGANGTEHATSFVGGG